MIKWVLIVVLSWIAFVSLAPHVSVLGKNFTRLEAYDWCSNVNNVIASESSECFKYWSPVHYWD